MRWDRRVERWLKGAVTLLLLAHFALIQLMAASPRLHEDLHCHGHRHGHEHGPGSGQDRGPGDDPSPLDEDPCAVKFWLAGGGTQLPAPLAVPLPADAPPLPVAGPIGPAVADLPPGHLWGGVAAHSPPRAP